jgi:hypothetical protein
MKHIDMNEKHFSILQQLDANEHALCKNYPEGRERCWVNFDRDDVRELKELIAIGMVRRAKNPLYNNRQKYHIPGSIKIGKYGYALTDMGRMAYDGIMQQMKSQTDD